MPLIPFPSVPKLPGVPAIPRSAKFPPVLRASLGVLQGTLWRALRVDNRWGIFDAAGALLFDFAASGVSGAILGAAGIGATLSTSSVNVSAESKVADFPVETGSFASYNKVEAPTVVTVLLCLTASEADRAKFLTVLETAKRSATLLKVATPEFSFNDYTLEGYRYDRSAASGATLLKVEMSLRKIRQVTAQYSQGNPGGVAAPKDVGATPKVDAGKVQANLPKVSTLKSLIDKAPSAATGFSNYVQGLLK